MAKSTGTVKITCKDGGCTELREHDLDISEIVIARYPAGNFVRFICPGCSHHTMQSLNDDQVAAFELASARSGNVAWDIAPAEAFESFTFFTGPALGRDDELDFVTSLRAATDADLVAALQVRPLAI